MLQGNVGGGQERETTNVQNGLVFLLLFERKQKGGFVKGGGCECTLVPVSGTIVPLFVPSFRFWGSLFL